MEPYRDKNIALKIYFVPNAFGDELGILGKSASGKKYQVEFGTFSLGKSTILVLFHISTFSYI